MMLDIHSAPDIILPLQGPKNIKSIAYDPVDKYIYWVDNKAKEVKRAKENDSEVSSLLLWIFLKSIFFSIISRKIVCQFETPVTKLSLLEFHPKY